MTTREIYALHCKICPLHCKTYKTAVQNLTHCSAKSHSLQCKISGYSFGAVARSWAWEPLLADLLPTLPIGERDQARSERAAVSLAWLPLSSYRYLLAHCRWLRAEWLHVVAGLTHLESLGQTEGCINRLKTTKRQMYGRAELPLLRQRMLHAA